MLPSGLKHLLLAQVPSEKTKKIAIYVQKRLIVDYPSGIIDIKFTFFLPTYLNFNLSLIIHHLTTITTGPGFQWDFVRLSLKTCSLYHENLLIQKFNEMYTQVPKYFFSASDIMEAVRGRFNGMNAI